MERGFALGVGLIDIRALRESNLQSFESLALRSAGVLVAIADAGGEHERGGAVLGGQLGIGSFIEKQTHHRGISGAGGAHQRRRAFIQGGVAGIHTASAGQILG